MSEAVDAAPSSEDLPRPSAMAWVVVVLLVAIFGLALWYYPPLKDASAAIETPLWVKFLGRFHVIALHLPVGVLALAAIMELFVFVKHRASQFLIPATTFTLMVGAAGAVVAVVFGIFLARKGGFGFAEFYAHQALGVATAIGALLTLILKLATDSRPGFSWPYRLVFALTLFLMTVGAHFGGNMVHESDYLTKYAPAPVRDGMERFEHFVLAYFEPPKSGSGAPHDQPSPPVGTQAAYTRESRTATVYAALVAPILADRCNSCHNEEKAKADLRLDTHEFILKGGTNGEVVVAGQPAKSKLVTALKLPIDDDDHMPPPKKPQPSEQEIALLSWWIESGASKSLTVAKAKVPDALKLFVKAQMARTKTGSTGGAPPLMLALAESAAQADPTVAEAMKKINGTGASLAPVAADAKELRFTALNVARDYADASLKELEPVAGKIVALDLAKTKITDGALASIAKMAALRELHLENTAVTDAGAAQLKGLANLEYLNLYGTKVTDKTLDALAGLVKLKALYLWQSGVTKAGVDAFKAKHPAVVVNAGWTDADNAKVVAVAEAKPAPAAAGAPAKPAAPAPAPAKTAPAPAAVAAAKPLGENAVLYKDVVAPILEAKCAACHGKDKSKGKLRLHTFAGLMKGGSDGATTVIAGKPDESLMIKRSLLPVDDDDHMPPKDEKQATKEEIAILKWWIEQGASETLTLAAAKKTPEIETALKALAATGPAAGAGSAKAAAQKPKAKPLTAAEKKAVAEVSAKMTALNASLMSVALDTEQLRFGCINAADKFGDAELGALAPVSGLIVWMDLGRSKVTDGGMATIAKMGSLERLHLENTAVTDAGLAQLTGLGHLEYLNLYGTKVTDAGIEKLAAVKSLRKLFLWQTGVTKDAAKKLEAAIPGLVVNVGLSEAEIAKLIEETKPPQAPEPAKPAEKKADAKPAAKKADAKAAPVKPAEAAKPAAKPDAPNNPSAPPVKTDKK
jgi:uncharacterized membrane protein